MLRGIDGKLLFAPSSTKMGNGTRVCRKKSAKPTSIIKTNLLKTFPCVTLTITVDLPFELLVFKFIFKH